mgnify:CR=1 FL=1
MTVHLKPEERLDDLQVKGYEIIQHPGKFCFGMDAVLLSGFAHADKEDKLLDLGTGTGVDPAEQFFILQNAAAQNDEIILFVHAACLLRFFVLYTMAFEKER